MVENKNLQIDFAEAERHLKLLDPNAKSFVFQTFDDSKNKNPRLARITIGPFEKCIGQLSELNNRGAGVFVTVNKSKGNGRKKSDIICCRTVFREADMPNLPDLPITPHLIIETSPGKSHEYFLIDDSSDFEIWDGVMQAMVDRYGSDPNAKDRSRVLRLAGFYHRKGKPHLVKIIKENKIARYSLDFVDQHILLDKTQDFQSSTNSSTNTHSKYGIKALANELEALFSTQEGGRNDQLNRSAYALGQLIGGGELEQSLVEQSLTAAAIGLGLSPNEVSATIRSGLSAGMDNPRKPPKKSKKNSHSDRQHSTNSENDCKINDAEKKKELDNALNLDSFNYELQRNKIADELGVRVSWLDELRKSHHKKEKAIEDDAVVSEDEPWPNAINGDDLMQEIVNQFERYIVLPDGAAVVMSAWVILTFCYDLFRVLPIMGIISPQKRCGKTTTLEVLSGLSYRALPASNISPAAIFRCIEKFHPTLLVDEADSFLKDNEETRGIINSGHTKATAFVVRCDGEDNDPKKFSTWAPKALAAIGKLPDTNEDRAIIVKLRRKIKSEYREKIGDKFDIKAATLRRKTLRWINDNTEALRINKATITIPGNDRATDNWAPLATIAQTIGGAWYDEIKKAAKIMHNIKDGVDDDESILLLTDIREIFDEKGQDKIFSAELVDHLCLMEERPWCDFRRGNGLNQNGLSAILRLFEIKSKKTRIGQESKMGYHLSDFEDTFNRYLHTSKA